MKKDLTRLTSLAKNNNLKLLPILAPEIIIGIDPDVDKSGFAIFLTDNQQLILSQFDLQDLFNQFLKYQHTHQDKILVRLEAGHKVKSTWHKGGIGMAKRVGSNNEIGRQIEKFLIKNGIQHELVKPFGGSKVNHETFCKITGWDIKKKTNPETRVAGLLAFKK